MTLPAGWTGERVRRERHERVAVLGDVHGRADLLLPLLARLDRPVLVAGDLCDRGPDTRACIDALIAAGATGVLGNHDVWLADWSSGYGLEPFALAPRMGGAATLASYGAGPDDWKKVPRAHAAWLNGLHLAIDLEVAGASYWLVHAGIPRDRELAWLHPADVVPFLARAHPGDLLWRKNDPHAMPAVDRPVILGHWPLPEPLISAHVLAIDTGAGALHQRLTALLLPERRTITVSAP